MMGGMCRHTGRLLTGRDHIAQSVDTILETQVGARYIRRDFGGELADFVDRPIEPGIAADLTWTIADAVGRWEDRVIVDRVTPSFRAPATLIVRWDGRLVADGNAIGGEVRP